MRIFYKIFKSALHQKFIHKNFLLIFCSFVFFFANQNPSFAQDLQVDLSKNFISLNTDFKGSKIVLFGSAKQGNDLAIVVSGPKQSIKVRRKEKVGGIWLNRDIYKFFEIPSYYSVTSNRDFQTFLTRDFIEKHQLTESSIKVNGQPLEGALNNWERSFVQDLSVTLREALLRFKKDSGMYDFSPDKIDFVGGNLFRADISLAPGVLTGNYEINVFEFKDGKLKNNKRLDLEVNKSGIEAYIFNLAHQKPLIYGLVVVLIAFFAGIFANFVFRRI